MNGIDSNKLHFGIFWVIIDNENLEDYKLIYFSVPCETSGNPLDIPTILQYRLILRAEQIIIIRVYGLVK